jgi:hypothetical protein
MIRKVEFLQRLFKLTKDRHSILEFLAAEKIILPVRVQDILHTEHTTHASQIAVLLEQAVKDEKVQLLDYEWTILPVERMSLTIVTQTDKRVFTYGD